MTANYTDMSRLRVLQVSAMPADLRGAIALIQPMIKKVLGKYKQNAEGLPLTSFIARKSKVFEDEMDKDSRLSNADKATLRRGFFCAFLLENVGAENVKEGARLAGFDMITPSNN